MRKILLNRAGNPRKRRSIFNGFSLVFENVVP